MLDLQGLRFRAAFFHALRSFFASQQFLEVDTPIRQPLLIPEANIEPLTAEGWLLQASPELCMKRMLAAGCSRIFQICNCFRKGERGRLHLEEFTMLEWYRTDADYRDLMADCEALLTALLGDLGAMSSCAADGRGLLVDEGRVIALQPPWERLTVREAFVRYSPVSVDEALSTDTFDEILVEHVEPRLGMDRPLFLCDYPVELGSLARHKEADPSVAERFELYVNGIELANGFSELTDADEQRRRFERELTLMEEARRARTPMPERFLLELPQVGRAAGIALGVDRLLMLLMGKTSVAEVVSFAPEELG